MRVALVLLVLVFGCAHDIHARFPATPDAPSGRLVLLLSQPASGVAVAINGVLVVDEAHTRRVVIDDIPTGTAEVTLAAAGGDKQFRVWIDDTRTTTVPIGVPEAGTALWKSLVGTVVSIAAYSYLR